MALHRCLYARLPVLLAAFTVLAGCDSISTTEAEPEGQVKDVAEAANTPPDAQPVAFQRLDAVTGIISGFTERTRDVIRGGQGWEAFWAVFTARLQPVPPVPSVDFGRDMVLVATMGTKPSGGFTIEVDEVSVSDGTVYVSVIETSPGPECMVPAVATSPVVAVTVALTDGPIRFVETSATFDCRG